MPESGPLDDSRVRFDGLFADLRRFKKEEGHLAMSTSHPLFVSIVDKLADVGMEELLKERFYDQLRSLREFVEGHGHCRVPDDHPTLGKWAKRQRGHCARFKRRLPSPLTRKRYAKLKEIAGFDELDPSKEDEKEETKEETKEEMKDGPVAPSTEGLTLDERISLKRAARRVRRMAAGANAFFSSKQPRDKEATAAELRKKRASRRAGGRTPRAEGGLASSGEGAASALAAIEETETDVPPASSTPAPSTRAAEREGRARHSWERPRKYGISRSGRRSINTSAKRYLSLHVSPENHTRATCILRRIGTDGTRCVCPPATRRSFNDLSQARGMFCSGGTM